MQRWPEIVLQMHFWCGVIFLQLKTSRCEILESSKKPAMSTVTCLWFFYLKVIPSIVRQFHDIHWSPKLRFWVTADLSYVSFIFNPYQRIKSSKTPQPCTLWVSGFMIGLVIKILLIRSQAAGKMNKCWNRGSQTYTSWLFKIK